MPLADSSIEIPLWPAVQARLERALALVEEHDLSLLERDCHECSVAHHLACYLKAEFPGWHVDCEFNRQGDNRDPKKNSRENRVRPDVIIHQRGGLGCNLVVIELKKNASVSAAESTIAKLKDYAEQQGYVYPVLLTYRTSLPIPRHPFQLAHAAPLPANPSLEQGSLLSP